MSQRKHPPRLEAASRLLDHQVTDCNGEMVCVVDDLEFSLDSDSRLRLTAIITGPGSLGPRIGGRTGGWLTAIWRRLRPDSDPVPGRVPVDLVAAIDNSVRLAVARDGVDVEGLERWVAESLISRIPGARHVAED